ncbi:MAG: ABC transporter permease [Pyrobaculum sp.]
MWLELIRLAWLSVREKAGRSALAAFGVFIAFLALTLALSIGESLRVSLSSLFEQLGLNTVWVFSGGSLFTDGDVALVQYLLKDAAVIPVAGEYGRLYLPDGSYRDTTIYLIPPEVVESIMPRGALRSGELYIGGSFVLISKELKMAGDIELLPGTPITFIKGDGSSIDLIVAGVFDASGLPSPLVSMPVLADHALARERQYFFIFIVFDGPESATRAVRTLGPYFPEAQIFAPETVARQVSDFASTVQLGLGALAGVGALVTAMWLYDTMMISILQRTREIGIKRAIGFKKRHILALLLIEAFIVVSIGIAAALPFALLTGMVKIPLGPGLVLGLEMSPSILATSALLIIVPNLLGVLAPAYRASRLNIVDALRYE